MSYTSMSADQRKAELSNAQREYAALKAKGLKLDMSRGKPGSEQLDLSLPMLSMVSSREDCFSGNTDLRNYGILEGLPESRRYFADLLDVTPEQVLVGGSSSLNLMYDVISKAFTHGLQSSDTPWAGLEHTKFLCPSPGYDRHFRVTEVFGMELIIVPMKDDGPDMDVVESLVKDPEVKGMWCVPKYSNPTGCIYSDAVLERIARLKPAAKDFLIMWDNAYIVHELEGPYVPLPDIISMCEKHGTVREIYEFCSTSKLTFPGAGVAALASTKENIAYMKKLWTAQNIGYDKLNQQRHLRFLKDKANTLAFMREHAKLMKPRFDAVLEILDREIASLHIASWTRPKGGYFISLDGMNGTAQRTVALCQDVGVVLTGAGAAFPYGKDPDDKNIRIAPSLPPVNEVRDALEALCICLRIATLEKLIG